MPKHIWFTFCQNGEISPNLVTLLPGNLLFLTCESVTDERETAEMPFEPQDDLQRVPEEQGNDDPQADYGGDQGQGDKELNHH